jgi:hypothetical protein
VLLSLREEPGWAWVGFACPDAAALAAPAAEAGGPPPAFDPGLLEALGARPDQTSQGPLLGLPRDPDNQPPAARAGADKA